MHQTSIKFLVWIVRKCRQIYFFFKYHNHDPSIFQSPLENHHTTHLVEKKKILIPSLSLANIFFSGNKQEKPRNGRKRIQVGVFAAEIIEHVLIGGSELVDVWFSEGRSRELDVRPRPVGWHVESLLLEEGVSLHASVLVRRTHHGVPELHRRVHRWSIKAKMKGVLGFNCRVTAHSFISSFCQRRRNMGLHLGWAHWASPFLLAIRAGVRVFPLEVFLIKKVFS